MQHVLFANEPFLRKMLPSIFSFNIPLYIQRNPLERLWKGLQMELKTYTQASWKFVFEKIKFKVLRYIQHDFVCQRLELSKDQISMFKSLVINWLLWSQIMKYF